MPYFGIGSGWLKRSQRAVAPLIVGVLRHDIMVPQQHPVERPGGGDELVTVLGEDDPLDQGIDRRILDADIVCRAGHVGRLGTPEIALLVARRQRFRPHVHDDVEVPAAGAVLVLGIVHGAHAHGDAEPLQQGLVEERNPFDAWIVDQYLDRVGLVGLDVQQTPIANFVAGLLQQTDGLAQIVANGLRIAADRIGIWLGEDFRRHLVAHGLEDFELLALRQSEGRELGAVEIAVDAPVLAEEQLLVHLLEIVGEVEGLPHSAHP